MQRQSKTSLPSGPRPAVIYLRISKDPSGERAGVRRQRDECEALAQARGWTVGRVYEDNDLSASKASVRRPGYESLLGAIERGEVGAVIAWHPDRLQRRPVELERFIDIVEAHAVEVATVSAGTYDLTTPAGRLSARIVGATARYEGEQKAARQQAKLRQQAADGEPLKHSL